MSDQNQQTDRLQDVRDIRRLMERSSRFISLSGLSGVAAGSWALAGAWVARNIVFSDYYTDYNARGFFTDVDFAALKVKLLGLAAGVFLAAFLSALYFTWRKSNRQGLSLWDHTSRRLFWNMAIPLATGGLFIFGMLQHNEWRFVAPCCLLFYGLALVNASKYTLTDIRYLGYCQIVVGLLNMQWIGYGLYFWALGFGVLHIIYGVIMWWKYERKVSKVE
ncbi:MAG: hypothetical protein ABW019_00380 [Chitinophagaceae bacterium]